MFQAVNIPTLPKVLSAEIIPCRFFPDVVLEEVVLKNGARCITATGTDLSGRALSSMFGACAHTPALNGKGIQHILEHLVVRGSENFPIPGIYHAIIGSTDASPWASTYFNKTWYGANANSSQGLVYAAKFLVDGMFNPLLTEDGFAKESFSSVVEKTSKGLLRYDRGVVREEMKQEYHNSCYSLLRNAVESLFPELLPTLNFGGDPNQIPTLSREEILNYHARFYRPDNSVFYISGPEIPDQIVRLISDIPKAKREFEDHDIQLRNLKDRINFAHLDFPSIEPTHGKDHRILIMIPCSRRESFRDSIFYDIIHKALFELDRNHYTLEIAKLGLKSTPFISSAYRLDLGRNKFFVIQIEDLREDDVSSVSKLVLGAYQESLHRKIPISTFEAALNLTRHTHFSSHHDAANWIFEDLTWRDFGPKEPLSSLREIQMLSSNIDTSYQAFLRFTGKLFKERSFVFIQKTVPMSGRSLEKTRKSIDHSIILLKNDALPTPLVPSYPMLLKTVIKSISDSNVSFPFSDQGIDQITSIPVRDIKKIHLNIGFDLSRLPSGLWSHAVAMLSTITNNRSSFVNPKHSNIFTNQASRESFNYIYSVTKNAGSYYWLDLSVFPEHLTKLLAILTRVLTDPDITPQSYLYGLSYQQTLAYSATYAPSATMDITDPFLTRGMGYFDPGYSYSDQASGFGATEKLNRLARAYDQDRLVLSEVKARRAINYLFSADAIHINYSAPLEIEDTVGSEVKNLYLALRHWPKEHCYLPANKISRNEIIVAPIVTNWTGRFFQPSLFDPAFEVPLNFLRFYAFSHELNSKRGFYRDFSNIDPLNGVIAFIHQRGDSSVAPFLVYDRAAEILNNVDLSPSQLKGLKMGALNRTSARYSAFDDPHVEMLQRLRDHSHGFSLQNYAEGVLSANIGTFRLLADLFAEEGIKSRNLLLTGKEGEAQARTYLSKIRWNKSSLIANP